LLALEIIADRRDRRRLIERYWNIPEYDIAMDRQLPIGYP
jgi:hypothetical protein